MTYDTLNIVDKAWLNLFMLVVPRLNDQDQTMQLEGRSFFSIHRPLLEVFWSD